MDTTTTVTGKPHTSDSGRDRFEPTPEVPPERRHKWWIWLIAAAVALGAIYWMYRQYEASLQAKQAKNQPVHAVPVSTATVQKGDIGVYVSGLGTVTPIYTVSVISRVQGQIVAIHYKEGQMVRAGDPLVDIDPRPYEAALTQAEGQLAHDEALLAQSRIDLDRYQAAFSRNAVAQQQVYDQEQLVKQYEGTVKNDQGVVDNAKVNLVYCHISSPITGRVGLRLVDLGNMVQANSTTALVVVTQLQPITVIFSINEDYLPQIVRQLRQGQKMTVEALGETETQKLATGTLLTVDNQADPTTGTVKLRATFQNTDNALFPNEFVNARLLLNTQHGTTLVPTAALQRNAQGAFVYVIKPDQTASVQTVTVGTTDGNIAAVQGVEEGQTIAVNGFDKLQDGIKVTVHTGSGNRGANASSSSTSRRTETP
jgi:membrane fusion protein, multidrug efflux system